MHDGAFDQWHQLLLVPGKTPGHISRAQFDRQHHQVDGRVGIDRALLALRAAVGRGGELSLGQAVHAVVLDDVDHVYAATHAVRELAQPDRRGITVARYPQVDQLAVRKIGAGQHRGHAAVHAVETVRVAEKIGGRLGRAADARELGNAMRRQIEFEAGLDDCGTDRIVAAAGAQRRDRSFVVPVGEAELVRRQLRMMEFRFCEISHMNSGARREARGVRHEEVPIFQAQQTRREVPIAVDMFGHYVQFDCSRYLIKPLSILATSSQAPISFSASALSR